MRMKMPLLVLGTMLLISIPALVASAQSSDPLIGTWVLNVAKSSYTPGTAPKSETRTYTATANGFTYSAKGIDADGKPTANTFTANFDGKYMPLTGSSVADSILMTRDGTNNAKATQKKGNKVVRQNTRVISKDGKTMTITSTWTDAAGKPAKMVEVFDKR
jgi:hypothetical protein